MTRIARVGGCPAVVAQSQSTGGSSQWCSGFNSRWLPAFSLSFKSFYFQHEARCSEHLVKVCNKLSWQNKAVVDYKTKLLLITKQTCCCLQTHYLSMWQKDKMCFSNIIVHNYLSERSLRAIVQQWFTQFNWDMGDSWLSVVNWVMDYSWLNVLVRLSLFAAEIP